jgi:hypothetical protein
LRENINYPNVEIYKQTTYMHACKCCFKNERVKIIIFNELVSNE